VKTSRGETPLFRRSLIHRFMRREKRRMGIGVFSLIVATQLTVLFTRVSLRQQRAVKNSGTTTDLRQNPARVLSCEQFRPHRGDSATRTEKAVASFPVTTE
jgi:hypothetical protein